jgi:thiol-disulfide isomerase/thioredoxin
VKQFVTIRHPRREQIPFFEDLLGVDGRRHSSSSFADARVLVVIFAANGCPSVRALEPWLVRFQRDYETRGVLVVWINSNNAALSPADSYEQMITRAEGFAYPFPYLKDADREVARRFGAETTPHAFVLDDSRRIRYRGRVADSRQASEITAPYVQRAVDDILEGREVAVPETEPYGCSIVW